MRDCEDVDVVVDDHIHDAVRESRHLAERMSGS
jgi:hypothetical protein